MPSPWGTRLAGVALGLLLAGAVAAGVVLNLPVRPPAGVVTPAGTAAAPQVVAWGTATVLPSPRFSAPMGAARQVDFVAPGEGWALVGCAPRHPCILLGTRDGGLTWTRLWSTRQPLAGMAFVSSQDGYAWTEGPFARLFATVDGGRTWHVRFLGGPIPWSSVAAGPHGLFVTVGGEMVRSQDGGQSWQWVSLPGCIPQAVRFAGADGVVVGTSPHGACAYQTSDGGRRWQPLLSRPGLAVPFLGQLASPVCTQAQGWPAGPGSAWLALTCRLPGGPMQVVVHTQDGGATWHLAWRGPAHPLAFLGTQAWREQGPGIAWSADGGRTFHPSQGLCANTPCQAHLDFLTPRTGYAATSQGVFATWDGGHTWHQVWPWDGPGPLVAAQLVTPRVGVAVPYVAPYVVLRTLDRGQTWQVWQVLPPSLKVTALDLWSAGEGLLLATRNGLSLLIQVGPGKARRTLPLPRTAAGPVQVTCAAFSSPDRGVVADVFGNVWATANGGASWTQMAPPPLGLAQALADGPDRTIYALVEWKVVQRSRGGTWTGGHLGLVRSPDGGKNWTAVAAWPWPSPRQAQAPLALATRGGQVWTVAYASLLFSADQGARFRGTHLPPALSFPASLSLADGRHGWLLTAQGTLWATGDGGHTWRQVP
jgi:photosystem II stability/assembly factor-like uncharacterized protein